MWDQEDQVFLIILGLCLTSVDEGGSLRGFADKMVDEVVTEVTRLGA